MSPSTLSLAPDVPDVLLSERGFVLRFASTLEELDAALRLRFEVFNLELGEGLAESHRTGRDLDPFDQCCHHLLVSLASSGEVIGTYRMQTSEMAGRGIGFYSAQEFDLSGMPPGVLDASVELGRACVAAPFRTTRVLFLLWRGLARYMTLTGKRFLFGCSSVTSQDSADGVRALRSLHARGCVHPDFFLETRPAYACPTSYSQEETRESFELPRLFRTYLDVGAKVCGGPAMDRAFKTLDFLVLLDLEELGDGTRALFF